MMDVLFGLAKDSIEDAVSSKDGAGPRRQKPEVSSTGIGGSPGCGGFSLENLAMVFHTRRAKAGFSLSMAGMADSPEQDVRMRILYDATELPG